MQKDALKHGLASLPAPRNDYEIVVPDAESQMDHSGMEEDFVPDQADIEALREAELKAKREITTFYYCPVTVLLHQFSMSFVTNSSGLLCANAGTVCVFVVEQVKKI